MSVGITVPCGALSLLENVYNMNRIVLKWTCGAFWHINESLACFFFDEDIIKTTSFLGLMENYALPEFSRKFLFVSWTTVHPFISLTFSQVDGWEEEDQLCSPLVLLIVHFCTFFLEAVWKTRCTARVWICWMNSKHGSMQQLQVFKAYVTACQEVTIGGMYAQLQMVFTVKCFKPSNFSTCM